MTINLTRKSLLTKSYWTAIFRPKTYLLKNRSLILFRFHSATRSKNTFLFSEEVQAQKNKLLFDYNKFTLF